VASLSGGALKVSKVPKGECAGFLVPRALVSLAYLYARLVGGPSRCNVSPEGTLTHGDLDEHERSRIATLCQIETGSLYELVASREGDDRSAFATATIRLGFG
jgi:hypothetical protein